MRGVRLIFMLFGIWASSPLSAAGLTVQVFNDKHAPLPNAVVYLIAKQPQAPILPKSFEIEQKNKMFHPFVTIMPIGSKATFPNRDGIGHHVYSFSPAKTFQLPLSDKVSTRAITFDKAGVVTVGCNIHDWMVAYIYVVNTNFYAKTGADGRAVIDHLPAGDYTVYIAHPGMKSSHPITKALNMSAGGGSKLEFTLAIKPKYFWKPAPRMHEVVY